MRSLLLDIVYIPLAILYLPILLHQMIVQKKNRRGWVERFGFIRRRAGRQPCVWIHAVSLGEVNATRSLVAEIEKRLPAHEIVISATTDTGYAAALKHYPSKQVFRYPLDFSFAVRRALGRIRPDAVILMELEVWPTFLRTARRRGIAVGVANGRVTEERSMRRFGKPIIRSLARGMFADITWTAAQNETYADRFRRLGAPADRVHVTGSMKYDTAVITDSVSGDRQLADALGIDTGRPLVVAGSTGPGEEELLLAALEQMLGDCQGLQFAIIPRKPERFDEVARLIEARGLECRRRSEHPDQPAPDAQAPVSCGTSVSPETPLNDVGAAERAGHQTDGTVSSGCKPVIFLGDTMGELRKFYALADAVFVGRSLVPLGGSDLMEVAGLGCAMCFGPHVENFAEVAGQLVEADAAVQVTTAGEIAGVLQRFLDAPEQARAMGGRARDVVRRNTGATSRTVDLLCESLGMCADHPESSISTAKLRQRPQSVS